MILFFAPRLHVETGGLTAIKKKTHIEVNHGLLARVLIQDNSMRSFRCRFDPDQYKLRCVRLLYAQWGAKRLGITPFCDGHTVAKFASD
jgi:hypothetical protein